MKKDIKIILKKDIILNKNLSNQAIMTYVGLAICLKPGVDFIYADKNMIYSYLSGTIASIPRRFDENIKNGLKELIDKNIVTCKKRNSGTYYFNVKDFIVDNNECYLTVYLSEINKIINSTYKGKVSLLRYYLCLLSTIIIDNKIKNIREPDKFNNKIGMVSQEYISDIANVSTHTVVEYTKILEKLELLYVSRCSFMFKDNNGNVKRHNNIYGRYIDRNIIDEFTKVRYEMYDDLHKVHMSSASNNSRSLMQKYNQMVKGKTYSKEVMDSIYNYINQYNKKYPNKHRNMDVFEQYGYYVEQNDLN